jgi:hypothetical protein
MTPDSEGYKAVPLNLLARFLTFFPVNNSGSVIFGPGMPNTANLKCER